ncbi:MAG: hypothetical protein QOK14_1439, partial [Frankiaceae bacterium]|nr:hypothetical protein [Frankiaceae bacterium]
MSVFGTTPSGATRGPLASAIVRLATTPDDESSVQSQLEWIAELGATLIDHADYVSVTILRGDEA